MRFQEFADELNIAGKVLAITRRNDVEAYSPIASGCALPALNCAMNGEIIRLSEEVVFCNGGKCGFGFSDEPMKIPGGYGHFVSYGAGEGYPPGLRLMRDPEHAERRALAQPKNVMDGYSIIEIKPYVESDGTGKSDKSVVSDGTGKSDGPGKSDVFVVSDGSGKSDGSVVSDGSGKSDVSGKSDGSDEPDLVTVAANPDQLSALNLLFHFRRDDDDMTIFPPGSGCSSIFRLPFGELRKDQPRAVIGNADISARSPFGADILFFTVAGRVFKDMLQDADESFLIAAAWKKIKRR